MKIQLFGLMLLIVSGCFGNKVNNKDSVNVFDDTLAIAFEEWKIDSLGCLGLRQKHIYDIVKYVRAIKDTLTPNILINLLGEPNNIIEFSITLNADIEDLKQTKEVVKLVYHKERECEDGFPISNCYGTSVSFIFIKEDGSFLWVSSY